MRRLHRFLELTGGLKNGFEIASAGKAVEVLNACTCGGSCDSGEPVNFRVT